MVAFLSTRFSEKDCLVNGNSIPANTCQRRFDPGQVWIFSKNLSGHAISKVFPARSGN
jgi:hypothetical protein